VPDGGHLVGRSTPVTAGDVQPAARVRSSACLKAAVLKLGVLLGRDMPMSSLVRIMWIVLAACSALIVTLPWTCAALAD
jgi:hypothetical protein